MENENVSKCLEYIGEQIKAYVVNRLANAPCTTAQLVGTFSLIVDHLSVSESSLIHVLDALYKENVVDFKMVNNTRLYTLINFDKDYIFELNIEKVEKFIAEYKLPYFSDHRKNVQEPLYFEARKNRTCIYINTPLFVQEEPVNVVSEIAPQETPSIDEDLPFEGEIITETKQLETSIHDSVEEDLSTKSELNSDTILQENDMVESNVFEENAENQDDDQSTDFDAGASTEDATQDFFENDEEENSFFEENSDDISPVVEEENSNSADNLSNIEERIQEETHLEPVSNIEDDEVNTQPQISSFDSIDFSSIDDSFDTPLETESSTYSQSDSMDSVEQHFAEALAKAMANSSQVKNEDSDDIQTQSDSTVTETTENQVLIEDNSSNDDLLFNVDEENNDIQNDGVLSQEILPTEDETPKQTTQSLAEEIVFTEVEIKVETPIDPEEERERQERALRMMEEILESKNTPQEPEDPYDMSDIDDSNEDDPSLYEPIILQKKPEPDKLTQYITEQERINNYDWHRRLQRALVDVIEEPEEDHEKEEEKAIMSTYSELKTLMASKNYVFKAYPSQESKSFYTENYVFSNRLARTTSIFAYIFVLIELIVAYFFVDPIIKKGFSFYIIIGIVLAIIPIFFILKYLLFKDKRKPANFVFGLSLVTALMIYINLMVMVVLVAFFVPALQVDVNNLKTMILTIFYPAGLFLNIPIAVCIYAILYRSKGFHLH